MIYSHIRLFIAGVEMPWSGNLTVTGGMMTTSLTFNLSDKEAYLASPLARTRFEDIPVKVVGLPPDRTLAEDESALKKNDHITDDDYVVLFDGAASLMMTYDPKSHRLDMNLRAVPGTVKALSSIVYSNLSIGSYMQSVESGADAVVQREVAAFEGNKQVPTGMSPVTGMNSALFIKKLIAGDKVSEIDRPTDMLDYAVSNILQYAGARVVRTESGHIMIAHDDKLNYMTNEGESSGVDKYASSVVEAYGRTTMSDDHGGEVFLIPESSRTLRLPDIILRRSVLADLITASNIHWEQLGTKEELSYEKKTELDRKAVETYLRQNPSLLVPVAPFTFFKQHLNLSQSDKLELKTSALPTYILKALTDAEETSITKEDNKHYEELWGLFLTVPEIVSLINSFMKVFLATFGLFSVHSSNTERNANLLSVVFDPETDKDWLNGLGEVLKDAITGKVKVLYQDMIVRVNDLNYQTMKNTLSTNDFVAGIEEWQKENSDKLYRKWLNSDSAQATRDSARSLLDFWKNEKVNPKNAIQLELKSAQLTKQQYETMQNTGILPQSEYTALAGNAKTISNTPKDLAGKTAEWLKSMCASYARAAVNVVATIKQAAATRMLLIGDITTSGFDSTYNDTDSMLHLNDITKDIKVISSGIDKLGSEERSNDAVMYSSRELMEPTLFDIKAAKALIDYAVYNKIGAPSYLRIGAQDKKEKRGYIYPHLALCRLQEFQHLVSNTACDNSNGTCSLYTLLAGMYSKLKLGLYTPLNKPYALQPGKQVSPEALEGIVEQDRSVLELMTLPVTELMAVPKCNVFCHDMERNLAKMYADQSNVTDILIRYQKPLAEVTETDPQGTLPPEYFKFDLQNPSGLQRLPKDWEKNNRYYWSDDDGTVRSSYKTGHIYNLFRTATIDVSSEVAATAELCRKLTHDSGTETDEQRKSQLKASSTLQCTVKDTVTSLMTNESEHKLKNNIQLTATIGGDDIAYKNFDCCYDFTDLSSGPKVQYWVDKASDATLAGRMTQKMLPTYKELYPAACAQVVLATWMPSGLSAGTFYTTAKELLTVSIEGVSSEFTRYVEQVFDKTGFKPVGDGTVYQQFKTSAVAFLTAFLTSESSSRNYVNGSKTEKCNYHLFDAFITDYLINDSFAEQAKDLISSSLFTQALAGKVVRQVWNQGKRKYETQQSDAFVFYGDEVYMTNQKILPYPINDTYTQDMTLTAMFNQTAVTPVRFLSENLSAARQVFFTDSEGAKTADDFVSAAQHSAVTALFRPDDNCSNAFTDIIQPVYKEIFTGLWRGLFQTVASDVLIRQQLKKRLKSGVTVTEIPLQLLINAVAAGFEFNADKSGAANLTAKIHGQSASAAAKSSFTAIYDAQADEIIPGDNTERTLSVKGLLADNKQKWFGAQSYEIMLQLCKNKDEKSIFLYDEDSDLYITDPLWTYLLYGKAFINVQISKDPYSVLTEPYYFISGTFVEEDYILNGPPSVRTPVFSLTDAKSISKFVEMNDKIFTDVGRMLEYAIPHSEYNNAITTHRSLNKQSVYDSKSLSDLAHRPSRAAVKVLVDVGWGNIGVGGTHAIPLKNPAWSSWRYVKLKSYPFVVWFDSGRKATVVMIDLTTGASQSDMLSLDWLFPKDTLTRPHNWIDTQVKPYWAPKTKDFDALWAFLTSTETNPFWTSGLVTTDSMYIARPVPMLVDEGSNGDALLGALQIPLALIFDHMQNGEFKNRGAGYKEELFAVDPRLEVGEYAYNMISTFAKVSRLASGTAPKTEGVPSDSESVKTEAEGESAGKETPTAASELSSSGPKKTEDEVFDFMFAGERSTGIRVSTFSYPDGTKRVIKDSDIRVAVACGPDWTEKCDVTHLRGKHEAGVDKFRIHGGVDFVVGATDKKRWADDPIIPENIFFPGDHKVVFCSDYQKGKSGEYDAVNPRFSDSFGFHAYVFPAAMPAQNEPVYIYHVGHLNPIVTINDSTFINRIKRAWSTAEAGSSNKARFDDLEELQKLGASLRSALALKKNYIFSYEQYTTAVENLKQEGLLETAQKYMRKLFSVFGRNGGGTLGRYLFEVKQGESIGAMGQSGVGSGPHYHCDCWVLDPRNIYHKSIIAVLPKLYRQNDVSSVINKIFVGKKSYFTPTAGKSLLEYSNVRAQVTEHAKKLYNEIGLINVIDALKVRLTSNDIAQLTMPGTDTATVIPGGSETVYKAPDDIVVSVAESRAYQEAIARLCTAQVEPIVLPYYDPYVMDAGMPAAVVYRNDVVLNKVASVTVTASVPGQCSTSIMFTPGISVAAMLPMYFKTMLSLTHRYAAQDSRYIALRDDIVFPFHCMEFFNVYPQNSTYMKENDYKQMFGRDNFIFDWREAVFVNIKGALQSVKEIVSTPYLLADIVSELSSKTSLGISVALNNMGEWGDYPRNEQALLLTERAWNPENLYTLGASLRPEFNFHSVLDAQVPAEAGINTYEPIAVERMLQGLDNNSVSVSDLKRTYYDWHRLFLELRKTVKTARPLSIFKN